MAINNDSILSWERHESLYFSDGNIVLRASLPGKDHGLLFRVHKSVLSSHSPVFSDMFHVCEVPDHDAETDKNRVNSEPRASLNSASEAHRFYDGVPLVDMPDDGTHLESVLKILYYQSTLPWTPRSPHYPALIAPILNISRKYRIDRIQDQVKGHLESDWPLELRDWDKLEKDIEFVVNNDHRAVIDDLFPEPAIAITIARQFDIPRILPAAFYHLSRISILNDWDKTHTAQSLSQGTQNQTRRTARWELLSAQEFHCLLLAREEIKEMVRGWTELPKNKLTGRPLQEHCSIMEKLWKELRDRCLQSTDPLAMLQEPIGNTVDGKFCQTCMIRLRDSCIPEIRGKIWENMGELCRRKLK